MKKQFFFLLEFSLQTICRYVPVILFTTLFFSCRKDALSPTKNDQVPVSISNFRISESKLVLLQGNATNNAVSVSWTANGGANVSYTVEAAITGTAFAYVVELGSTQQLQMNFSVQVLNNALSQLLYANNTGSVDIRVRAQNISSQISNPVYTCAFALQVTTYQNYTEYGESNTFKIPGNYQGWNLSTAPKIVSTGNSGEYEGYINFTNPYSQLLMVKGNEWDPKLTYGYIGDSKFGFGGSVMSVFGGAGVYLFKANANINRWTYTKINNWGITGTAVAAGEMIMKETSTALSWTITGNLVKGSFRFRANSNDAISFGQKSCDNAGVPSYDGENIIIKQDGNYTLKLELQLAGNYAYSIMKN